MTVRVALLTTDTPHHVFFAQRLAEMGDLVLTVVETTGLHVPYETHHPFEDERDAYEVEELLGGRRRGLGEVAPVVRCKNANVPEAVGALGDAAPEVTFVFGTGVLRRGLIDAIPGHLLNLHGGDPERYRGLDTHLWAIWHNDPAGLVTALHELEPRLDAGAIVAAEALRLPLRLPLAHLRALNARVCVRLAEAALERVADGSPLDARRQRQLGRYYSAMPSVLKQVCVERMERWADE